MRCEIRRECTGADVSQTWSACMNEWMDGWMDEAKCENCGKHDVDNWPTRSMLAAGGSHLNVRGRRARC